MSADLTQKYAASGRGCRFDVRCALSGYPLSAPLRPPRPSSRSRSWCT